MANDGPEEESPDEVVERLSRDPELGESVRAVLRRPEISDDGWLRLVKPFAYWEAWGLQVKVSEMPDGSRAVTGIRIEPREDYDGSVREQKITAANLRRLPLPYLLNQWILWASIANESSDVAIKDAVVNSHVAMNSYLDNEEFEERKRQVGRERARLEQVAAVYSEALATNPPGGPRKHVARELHVSTRTVDRLLKKARQAGVLPPYDGRQGKHGKEREGGGNSNE